MVHALKEIHKLLKPDGVMIDIHPLPERPDVLVFTGEEIVFSEPMPINYLADIVKAVEALERVVELRLFIAAKDRKFEFNHYAASPSELKHHWETLSPYEDSPIDEAVVAGQDELFAKVEEFVVSSNFIDPLKFAIREHCLTSRYVTVREGPPT